MPMNLATFLSKNKSAWAEQAARSKESREYQRPDDGDYIFKLSSATIEPSKQDEPQVQAKWIINDNSEFHGEQHTERFGLAREDGFYWLWVTFLSKMGYDPDDYPDPKLLPKLLADMTKAAPSVKGRLKTKGDWQNMSIIELLDGNGEGEEGDELEVGMTVEFELNGKTLQGEVTEIDEDENEASVKVGKKVHTVSLEDITIVPDDEDDPEPEPEPEPEPVKAPAKGRATPAPAAKGKAVIPATPPAKAPAKGKPAPAPEPEPEPEDEGEGELEVGMTVEFEQGGKTKTGVVTAIDEDEEEVTVKVGKNSYTVAASDVAIVEDEE